MEYTDKHAFHFLKSTFSDFPQKFSHNSNSFHRFLGRIQKQLILTFVWETKCNNAYIFFPLKDCLCSPSGHSWCSGYTLNTIKTIHFLLINHFGQYTNCESFKTIQVFKLVDSIKKNQLSPEKLLCNSHQAKQICTLICKQNA